MITTEALSNSKAAVKYYTEYCIAGGEKEGLWYGGAVSAVCDPNLSASSLEGQIVLPDAMQKLAQGFSPDGEKLVRNAGDDHKMGIDFCFSAPKSVSIVWCTADDKTRKIVEDAHNRAVKTALDYLEKEAGYSRKGKGGHTRIKANNLFALFQHSSSRAGDPQLHTHSIMFNVAHCEDGVFRTLQYAPYYRRKMTAGALYKADLAHALQKAGFKTRRTAHSFEIVGVPEKLIEFRSTRSKEINELAEQSGLDRASASVFAKQTFNFISRKEHGTEKKASLAKWQEEHRELGFTEQTIEGLMKHRSTSRSPSNRMRKHCIKRASIELTDQRSTFPDYVYLRRLAENSIGSMSVNDIQVNLMIAVHRILRPLQRLFDNNLYTSNQKFFEEQETVSLFKGRIDEGKHAVKKERVERIIKRELQQLSTELGNQVTLTPDQEATILEIATGRNGVSLIEGFAGSGKTFAVQFLNKIYSENGFQLRALAPTNKAAKTISNEVGIPATTVHSFLYRKPKIDQKTVLVVDEAAMLASSYYNKILKKADLFGAKVIFVGDVKQVQPVESGQMFGTFQHEFESSQLTTVRRQRNEEERDAILTIREGDVGEAFKYYDGKKLLNIEKTQKKSEQNIIRKWFEFKTSNPSKTALIIATTNYVVSRLNQEIRAKLKAEGQLAKSYRFIQGKGEIEVAKGDVLIFTKNDKARGILNSDIVEVVSVSSFHITVKKDDGKSLTFNPAAFTHFQHGYAITPHKSQGMTVDKAFVVVDGNLMDREKLYVALSRGRENNELFINAVNFPALSDKQQKKLKAFAGDEKDKLRRSLILENVIEEVKKSHIKDTSQDYGPPLSPLKTIEKLQLALKQDAKELLEGRDVGHRM